MDSRIAYIDDSLANLEVLEIILEKHFKVDIFQNPLLFLEKFPSASYDAIILDIHMPGIDGFTVYEKVMESSAYNGCPILFLSSDDTDSTRIRSFELGAVDFMSRDLTPEEIVSRIKSKIKFFESNKHIVEFGSLKINFTELKAYFMGHELPLTFIELKLLSLLIRTFPNVVPKEEIVEQVWKGSHVLDATIYTHVSNLKAKLKEWEYEIQNVKMKGMQLVKKLSL